MGFSKIRAYQIMLHFFYRYLAAYPARSNATRQKKFVVG